jgi:hypothetical protein
MKARRRVLRRLTSVVAGLVILVCALPAGASAVVTDAVYVETLSPADSASTKSVTSSCPAGKQVLGGGGDLISGSGQVIFDDLTPAADLKSVTVKGAEDETGFPVSWTVQALAICATPPPGLQRVSATSPLNSSNKSVTATCPAGKRVVGTGADINAGNGQVAIDDMTPNAGLTAVTVQALEDQNGQAGPWNVIAYAICANPIAGLERVSATSALNSNLSKHVEASCPGGKGAVGTGSDINAGSGQVQQTRVFAGPHSADMFAQEDQDGLDGPWSITAFAICADVATRVQAGPLISSTDKFLTGSCLNGMVHTGVGAEISGAFGQAGLHGFSATSLSSIPVQATEDQTGTSNSWSLRNYGVCRTPLPGQVLVSSASPSNSVSGKSATATCPAGTRVVGAAGDVSGSGQVLLRRMRPSVDLLSVDAIGFEDEDGTSENWTVRAHSICATAPPGLQLVSAASTPDDAEEISAVTVSCPAGKYLLGTGGGIVTATGEAVIDDLRPNAALTNVTVTGIEDETGLDSDWNVEAQAICADRWP